MPREPIPTWFFAATVVRLGDRFLLVQERKHDGQWSLPAGRVGRRESLIDAAVRETREEAGVLVRVTGLVRIEHTPRRRRSRLRAVFLAEPIGDTTPKQVADEESLGAAWVSLDELSKYELRGPEIGELLRYVAAGGRTYSLDVLQEEGGSYDPSTGRPSQPRLRQMRTTHSHAVPIVSTPRRALFATGGVVALAVTIALAAFGFALSGLWPGVSWAIGSALALISLLVAVRWLRVAATGRRLRPRQRSGHRGAV